MYFIQTMDPLNDVFLRKFEVVLSRKKIVGQFILGLAKTFMHLLTLFVSGSRIYVRWWGAAHQPPPYYFIDLRNFWSKKQLNNTPTIIVLDPPYALPPNKNTFLKKHNWKIYWNLKIGVPQWNFFPKMVLMCYSHLILKSHCLYNPKK